MTDFFEFCWAHQMEGTTLRHLWPWFRTILFRRPDAVPRSLRVLWALLIAAIFAVTRRSNIYFPNRLGFFGDWVGGPLAGVMGSGISRGSVIRMDDAHGMEVGWLARFCF